ncbi:threonine dehydrogenase-like Zn-dependent dehydrogenase [Micromonospora endolithica]|nr:threonine dehydrogenase-like Zn-dependent dehydrogenase [Micromonospora endolithica]
MTETDVAQPRTAHAPPCSRVMITGPGQVEIVREHLPALGPDAVYAESVVSGISHGTEMAWVAGDAAALHRSWDSQRRIFLDGAGRDFPVAPGYETIARVTAVGEAAVGKVSIGDLVTLDRPHGTAHIVPADAAVASRLPAGVDAERAVFFILARVALGGVHDAEVRLGDTVVVVGLGTVGLLAGQLARLAGAAKVIGVDRYPLRLDTADSLGITPVHAATDDDIAVQVRKLCGPQGADVAIEASGSYGGLHEAIRCVRIGGQVATVASYHGDQNGLRLGEEYHRNRITLVSSMTVNGCPQRAYPAWDLPRLSATARDLVIRGHVHVDSLVTHRFPFDQAAEAYHLIAQRPEETIKVVLTYDK